MKKYIASFSILLIVVIFVALILNKNTNWNSFSISIIGIGKQQEGENAKNVKTYLEEKERLKSFDRIFFQYELHLSNNQEIMLFFDKDKNKTVLEWNNVRYQTDPSLYQMIEKQIEPNISEENLYLRLGVYEKGSPKGEAFQKLIEKHITKEKEYTILSRNNIPSLDDNLYYINFEIEKNPYIMLSYYVDGVAYLLDYKENKEEMMTTEEYAKYIYQASSLTKEHSH